MIHHHRKTIDGDGAGETADAGVTDASAPFFAEANAPPQGGAPPGSMIGRYRIVREIGSGGMGVVYEAIRDDLHRRVALKTLHASARAGGAERLHREAETLARLDHPGIASIIDAFAEGDRFCIVMDLIEGRPITDAAAERSLRGTLRLFLDVCRAVEHAHLRGVAHRDLKPGNIFVDPDGRPVVLDFGLARLVEDGAGGRVTQTGQLVGTLAYMSPEQASGDDAAIDVRADVYSLGVVLYEMVTGELPIDVPTGSVVRAARAIELTPPTPPSRRSAALKGDLDQILLKALEKSPGRRYDSAADLARDIERHLEHRPIEARPPTALYRASRYVRRHRAMVLGAGATILALTIGLGIATTQMIRARAAERRATERFNDVRELANTVIFDLHDAIEGLPGATEARATLVERALEYLDRLEGEAGDDPGFRLELAESYLRLGDAQAGYYNPNMMQHSLAATAHRRSIAIFQELHDAGHLDLDGLRSFRSALRSGSLGTPIAQSELAESRYGVVKARNSRSLEISDRIIASAEATDADHAAHAEVLTYIALTLFHRDSERARIVEAFDAAEAAMRLMTPEGRSSIAALSVEGDLHQRRGTVLLKWGEPEEAAERFRRSVEALSRAHELAPRDWLIRRRLAFSFAEGSIALGRLGDPAAERFAEEGMRMMRERVKADATDRRSLRDLDAGCYMAAEGLYQLAMNAPQLTPDRRRALLEESRRLFQEAARLVKEREARGELPEWEAYYPAAFEDGIRRVDEALAAMATPAT